MWDLSHLRSLKEKYMLTYIACELSPLNMIKKNCWEKK